MGYPNRVSHIFIPVGIEPQVRVRGARGALPVADAATQASGSGRCATQSLCRQGAHRAPQQDTDTKAPKTTAFGALHITSYLFTFH